MGWTGTIYTIRNARGQIDRKATLERDFAGWTSGEKVTRLVRASMAGSTFYAAMETTSPAGREVWALVILTKTSGAELFYKEMDETEGPTADSCPACILDLLTPTTNADACAWRERCRQNATEKRTKGATIPRNATEIYITFKTDSDAASAGESVTVRKTEGGYIFTDKTGKPWRILPVLLRNPDFCTITGTDADKKPRKEEPAPEAQETATESPKEAQNGRKPEENTPAAEKREEKPHKAGKVCYNVVIYTAAGGVKRADIRTESGAPYLDIPAAELDAIREEIARKDPGRVSFLISDTTTEPTTPGAAPIQDTPTASTTTNDTRHALTRSRPHRATKPPRADKIHARNRNHAPRGYKTPPRKADRKGAPLTVFYQTAEKAEPPPENFTRTDFERYFCPRSDGILLAEN